MSASRGDTAEAVIDLPEMPELAGVAEAARATGARRVLRWVRKRWQIPVGVATLGLAYLSLRDHLPSVHDVAHAAATAHVGWIIAAAVCEAASLAMFARQQRALLIAVGVRISMLRALAITYARSALGYCVPAGSAVSAGFAFQQYRRSGASNDRAAAVMVLSGVLSFLGIAVLYVTGTLGALMAEPRQTATEHPVLLGSVIAAVILAIGFWIWRHRMQASPRWGQPSTRFPGGYAGWWGAIRRGIADTIVAWRSIRARDWSRAGAFAVLNWLLDLLCLIAAARAFDLEVGVGTVAAVYLGTQIVRQIPLTPGGIGLIETTLLTGLVNAGASSAGATAAILLYRIFSCWLIIPIGGLAYLGLRRPVMARAARPEPAAELPA